MTLCVRNAHDGAFLLKDIRVLDLADEKGSFCSRLLADLGASVIKIERPEGDKSRKMGPFTNDTSGPEHSLFFAYHNANKRGITANLNEKTGKKTFRNLVKRADVLVESFQPGHLADNGSRF